MKKLILILFIIPLFVRGQVVDLNNYETSTDCGAAIIDLDKIYSCYNDAAEALFARMDVQPPANDKRIISTVIDTLQHYHIACNTDPADDSLDFYYDFAMHTSQVATLDWIRTSTTATLVNSPVHTPYEGFLTDGAASLIKTNYNPGTDSVSYGINSASIGFYIRTNDYTISDLFMGINDGSSQVFIFISTIDLSYKINCTTAEIVAHGNDVTGFSILTRQNATTIAYARNSDNYSTASNNSVSTPNQASGFFVGAYNNNGSPSNYMNNQFSFAFGGGQLTELQKTKLFEIQEWKLDQYGKGVNP